MNQILFVARKAKGLTEKEVAVVLEIHESQYKEIESSLREITYEEARLLGDFYHIPDEWILSADALRGKKLEEVLEKHMQILEQPETKNFYPEADIKFAQMAMGAIKANEQLCNVLKEHILLKKDHIVLQALYRDLKKSAPQQKEQRSLP